jgi:hypothetical protein
MLVRSKQRERSASWRRRGSRKAPPSGAADNHLSRHGAERPAGTIEPEGSPRERRHGGPVEDRALYTCECGYAFEALVTTSVGCPHCTRTQAW